MTLNVSLANPPVVGPNAPARSCSDDEIPPDSPIWQRLLLVRHGESTCNEVNRFAGSENAPLTALGRAQAHRAARSRGEMIPDCTFVSPLSRAVETAEILIPTGVNAAPFCVDARIAERDFGAFTLRNKAELQRIHGIRGYDEALYDASETMVGAESLEEFHQRVAEFLSETVVPRLQAGERVLVVAHKYVVELMARIILRVPPGDGFDFRLPNSRVLHGDDLARCCRRENRFLNRFRDWAVLRHDWLLSAAAISGLGCALAGVSIPMPWLVGIFLLMMATAISLMRVDLDRLRPSLATGWSETLSRFALLPGALAWIGIQSERPGPWLCAAVILAAPAALTSVTMSRCAGGLVIPAVGSIFRSSVVGCIAMVALLQLVGGTENLVLIPLLLGLAFCTILAPSALACWLRRRAPIATATFGERQAILPVLLLGAFVFGAVAQLDPMTFFPHGWIAIAASVAARIVARALVRQGSLEAADDFLSMAYPNLFLVIVLGQLSGIPELVQTATWFLLPMFLLTPIDLRICGGFFPASGDDRLREHLGIRRPTAPVRVRHGVPMPETACGSLP